MPIVMGEPVGLATDADAGGAADPEDAAGADALAAGGALADTAAVALELDAAVGALDDGVDAFDFDELQPAMRSTVAEIAAIDPTGIGRQKQDACNRLCETIESLHEGVWLVSGGGTWLDLRFQEGCVGGLCNRLCNRSP
jgi:hypothetical protein